MTGVRGVYVACVFFEPPTVLISFYSKNLSDITLYLNYYVLWGCFNRDIKEGAGIYSTPTPLPQPIQLGGGMRHLKPDHIQIFDLQYARLVSE